MNIVILGYYRKQLVGASAAGFRLDLRPQVSSVFLASIVVSSRILSLVTSLLLTVQLCSRPQPLSGRPGDGGSLSVVRPPMTDAPVGRLTQVLPDTGTTGRAGADARLALQARASVCAFYGPALTPVWTVPTDSITPAAATALGLPADAPTVKLRTVDYGWPRLRALRDSLAQSATAGIRAARFGLTCTPAIRCCSSPTSTTPTKPRAKACLRLCPSP